MTRDIQMLQIKPRTDALHIYKFEHYMTTITNYVELRCLLSVLIRE